MPAIPKSRMEGKRTGVIIAVVVALVVVLGAVGFIALRPGGPLQLPGIAGVDKSGFVGKWELVEGNTSGLEADTLEMLHNLGLYVILTLNQDDTATFALFDEESEITWKAESPTQGSFEYNGSTLQIELKDGMLVAVDAGGDAMTFIPHKAASASGAAAARTSSSAAASSSSASLGSAVSSSASGSVSQESAKEAEDEEESAQDAASVSTSAESASESSSASEGSASASEAVSSASSSASASGAISSASSSASGSASAQIKGEQAKDLELPGDVEMQTVGNATCGHLQIPATWTDRSSDYANFDEGLVESTSMVYYCDPESEYMSGTFGTSMFGRAVLMRYYDQPYHEIAQQLANSYGDEKVYSSVDSHESTIKGIDCAIVSADVKKDNLSIRSVAIDRGNGGSTVLITFQGTPSTLDGIFEYIFGWDD